jgi:hypothetical protein
MPKVSLASFETAARVAALRDADGSVETRAIFNRDFDPIHLYAHRLSANTTLSFSGTPCDCLVYVWDGTVHTEVARLGPRSSAIVEFGRSLAISTRDEPAVLLEFKLKTRGAQARIGGHVHVLPSEHVARADSVHGKKVGMALHADAQCPTCTLWFHENDFEANSETPLHSHSEDEVIFVRAGSIRLGNRLHGPGTALAIAANTKYAFFAGPQGLSFVNFRGSSPTITSGDGAVVMDEAELWRTTVGKPRYLALT